MYTVFHPELAGLTARLTGDFAEFLAGDWDAGRLHAHQLAAFRETVRYTRERSPFYRRHLSEVDPETITALDAASIAHIPFTTKDDLRREQFGMLSKKVSDAWIFYETTGTTGSATPCPRDNVDTLHNNAVLTAYYETVFRQFGEDQVVGVSGPTELHATGDTFGDVCRNLGLAVAKMWPHSPVIGFPRALEVMRMLPITGLFCTPGMALSLAKAALRNGVDPAKDFELRTLMMTGELVSPSLLRVIGELWGAKAYNCLYASQEASILAASGADGALYQAPLINYYEVIDPETLALAQPDAEGIRRGELVVTNLYQGVKPLVRYRTGDLVRERPPARDATVPAPRMEILGRVRDQLDINGHLISGYDLEDLLLEHVGGFVDYQITIDREAGRDVLHLLFQPRTLTAGDPGLAAATVACRERLGAPLTVSFGEPGAVTATGAMVSWKAARVVDRRVLVTAESVAAQEIASRRTG